MSDRPKILLLDDEPDILELYRELLTQLPSQPEIRTAATGARALAMLDAEPYSLLLCDLNMPSMDGLQVLTIVRRKFPQLRTVVMTAVTDPQFRHRAYALGLDLYLEKPNDAQAIKQFQDCIESVLGQNVQDGFRGVQSKSLVDIIQLECLCQNSAVLKVSAGAQEGRFWLLNGEIVDAAAGEVTGETAFYRILSWKTGNFEMLPAEPDRPRQIHKSCHSLLLENAQAQDEAQPQNALPNEAPGTPPATAGQQLITALSSIRGVEFLLLAGTEDGQPIAAWAVEMPEAVAAWAKTTMGNFSAVGDLLEAGQPAQIIGYGLQHHIALIHQRGQYLCVGLQRSLAPAEVQETLNRIRTQWAS